MRWIHAQLVALFMCCIKLQIRPASSACPYQYTFMDSSCFRFVSNVRTSWQDAQQKCSNEDSHLAVLDTTPKRDVITRYMKANHIPFGTWYWVDGRDPQQNGNWIWYSKGTGVDSALWYPGEPSTPGLEECMHLRTYGSIWGLNDVACNGHYAFICEKKSVNGAWGAWGSWSGCSLTCGTQGLRYRSRQCNNPSPLGLGNHCPGSGRETEVCFPGHCPVNGAWGSWGHWGPCTKTCGGGIRWRYRSCNSPSPLHGGQPCPTHEYPGSTSQKCNEHHCPIDGGWDFWGPWGSCSMSCGGGTRTRFRTCTKPKPEHGGKQCPSGSTESGDCNQTGCPTCQIHNVPGAMSSVPAARINEKEYVRYFCLPDHKLVSGSLIRTCQANGTLSGAEPQCKTDGHCNISAIQAPKNGFAACSGSEVDKVCYMRCDNGYNYMSDRTVFECGAPTGWEWKVREKSRKYVQADVGVCKATDETLVKLLMGITGPRITMASVDSDEKLKQNIISEMKKELLKLNVCTVPCEIKGIQVERTHGTSKRRAISQAKLFGMTINIYAAVPKGPLTTQQSATLALSKKPETSEELSEVGQERDD